MRLNLTPEEQSLIESMVDSGEYPDAASVVEAALLVLKERERALKHLRSDIGVGLQQIRDDKVTVDSDEMWDEIEARANMRFEESEKKRLDVSA